MNELVYPTPWKLSNDPRYVDDAEGKWVCEISGAPSHPQHENTRRLIVRAVNSHEALLAACKFGLAELVEAGRGESPAANEMRAAIGSAA